MKPAKPAPAEAAVEPAVEAVEDPDAKNVGVALTYGGQVVFVTSAEADKLVGDGMGRRVGGLGLAIAGVEAPADAVVEPEAIVEPVVEPVVEQTPEPPPAA